MAEKSLKDPIYGYITIDEEIMYNVVDTPTFQRLRNIVRLEYIIWGRLLMKRFIDRLPRM